MDDDPPNSQPQVPVDLGSLLPFVDILGVGIVSPGSGHTEGGQQIHGMLASWGWAVYPQAAARQIKKMDVTSA